MSPTDSRTTRTAGLHTRKQRCRGGWSSAREDATISGGALGAELSDDGVDMERSARKGKSHRSHSFEFKERAKAMTVFTIDSRDAIKRKGKEKVWLVRGILLS